MIATQEHK